MGCLRARAFPERTGSTLVLVANLANAMLPVDVAVAGLNTSAVGSGGSNAGGTYCGDDLASDGSGIQVEVLFEHRNVSVRASDGSGGVSFGDFVAPLGTRAYRIHATQDKELHPTAQREAAMRNRVIGLRLAEPARLRYLKNIFSFCIE